MSAANQVNPAVELEEIGQFRRRCVLCRVQIHWNGGRPVARLLDGPMGSGHQQAAKLEEAFGRLCANGTAAERVAHARRLVAEWLQHVTDHSTPLVTGELPDGRLLVAWVPARHRGTLDPQFDPVREVHRGLVAQAIRQGTEVDPRVLGAHL
ncbi:MAG: hypothetical protein ING52_10835 [Burkholderiales bacterium]|jgi:hypothetical protein|nr:hypothetical protein [Burkholderiales bacterium]